MRENFTDLCAETCRLLDVPGDGLVVDIGSNDGTLLSNFKEAGFRVLGIEPSRAGEVAKENGIETLTAYFDAEVSNGTRDSHGPAALIMATNVFAHISDPHALVDNILALLDDNGVFVSESHYLLDLVETLQYDTIYHEHLR